VSKYKCYLQGYRRSITDTWGYLSTWRTCVNVKIILAGSIDPNAASWRLYENTWPEQVPAGRIQLSRFPVIDKARSISLIAISLSALISCQKAIEDFVDSPIRSFENQVGTRFSEVRSFDFKPPEVRDISLEYASGGNAIWGAIGRSDHGKLYLGASTHAGKDGTAFLYQYDPLNSTLTPEGDVLGQLQRLGRYKPGMGQNKLHSKFYQADDDYLYFSSFDEQGEDTGVNPTWGGHLWRKKEDDKNWEHILATREALIAVNLAGNYVYSLGYWDHVLYQFDTQSDEVKRVVVGSVPNHVSRNFLVDPQGHAYVPKVILDSSGTIQAQLNEYDTRLELIGSYAMPSYKGKNMAAHHGIIGYTSMASGNILFTTSDGGLYELNVFSKSGDKLSYLGMMHPDGGAYIPSLFPLDGNNLIAGVGRVPGKKGYEWIIYELRTRFSVAYKMDTSFLKDTLLYGTLTRDDAGNFYLVGRGRNREGEDFKPVLLQIPVSSLWPTE
jgi:hypothetical protein